MPEDIDQPAPPTDHRDSSAIAGTATADRRVLVWWGVAFGLLALLGAFCWFFLRPVSQVRAELNALVQKPGPAVGGEAVVERLGGPHQAFRKIRLYLRLPGRQFPERRAAAGLLGWCGREAVPLLRRLAAGTPGRLQLEAAAVLKKIQCEEPPK